RSQKSRRQRNNEGHGFVLRSERPLGVVVPGRKRESDLQCEGGRESQSWTGKGHLTQNQLHELLDSDQAKALVEGAEERGHLEADDLEAHALVHDLNEAEVVELACELDHSGL